MKNIILSAVTIVMLLISGMLHSAKAQSPISFGLKGGLNISNFHGSDFDFDARNGLMVGAVVGISLPALPVGLETGLFYTQKGAKSSDEGITGALKVDYLEIPVLAKINLGPPGPIQPHLMVGPYLGFNINSEAEISGGGASFSGDISDETNNTEFGGLAAVGIDFNLGLTKLNAQLRYNYGFTSVFKDDFDDSAKNGSLSIVVGIMF